MYSKNIVTLNTVHEYLRNHETELALNMMWTIVNSNRLIHDDNMSQYYESILPIILLIDEITLCDYGERLLLYLADCYLEYGDKKIAMELSERAHRILTVRNRMNHPQYLKSINLLAELYYEWPRPDDAIKCIRELLEIIKFKHGIGNTDYFNWLIRLVKLLELKDDHEAIRALLLANRTAFLDNYGENIEIWRIYSEFANSISDKDEVYIFEDNEIYRPVTDTDLVQRRHLQALNYDVITEEENIHPEFLGPGQSPIRVLRQFIEVEKHCTEPRWKIKVIHGPSKGKDDLLRRNVHRFLSKHPYVCGYYYSAEYGCGSTIIELKSDIILKDPKYKNDLNRAISKMKQIAPLARGGLERSIHEGYRRL